MELVELKPSFVQPDTEIVGDRGNGCGVALPVLPRIPFVTLVSKNQKSFG